VRIKKAWIILLQRRGYLQPAGVDPTTQQPLPGDPTPALDKALTFRAHLAAHVQYAKAEAQAKMMQQPVQAAPGEQPQNSAPGATTQQAA
jgi:phosphoglycerate dehydrogenase-like enzyme